jgi:predicted O-methyltransferase YrrM
MEEINMKWEEYLNSLVGQETIILKDSSNCKEFFSRLQEIQKKRVLIRDNMEIKNTRNEKQLGDYKYTLYNLVVCTDASLVVELGVRQGNSTDAFVRALSNRENGRLISFDPAFKEMLLSHIFMENHNDFWTFHYITGEEGYEKFKDQITNIDFLYIDTDPHSYQQTKIWLNNYWIHNVRPGGFVVFDDCAPQHQQGVNWVPKDIWNVNGTNYGILKAVVEFIDQNSEKIDFAFTTCNTKSNGVGVIKLI